MRVVSENSPTQVAHTRFSAEIRSALKELTANLLRVTRGAGKPEELPPQADRFVQTVLAYKDAVGAFPEPTIFSDALSIDKDEEYVGRLSEENLDRHYATQAILRGALQIIASKMLGQLTIQRSGEKDFHDGIRELGNIREERHRRMQAEWSGSSKPPKKT